MHPIVKVMLVDDEEDFLEELSDSLLYQKTLMYTFEVVATARTGSSALPAAELRRPDLALIDFEMPGMNGLEAAKAIRKLSPATKTIILSCHHNRVDMYTALEAQIRGYVLKNRFHTLFSALEEVLQDGIWFDPLVLHQMYDRSLRGGREPWTYTLSSRENQVLVLLQQGHHQSRIASELRLGLETVKSHLASIRTKAGCANLSELRLKLPRISGS